MRVPAGNHIDLQVPEGLEESLQPGDDEHEVQDQRNLSLSRRPIHNSRRIAQALVAGL